MVVWGYPCESKSSPAFKYKTPHSLKNGVFFYACGNVYKVEIGRKIRHLSIFNSLADGF
jgi:hypothetical protein